jgi:hypothetical protein
VKSIRVFGLINFLSAFLLFQIELIAAKLLLPRFGGSYLVWGAAMVFFQCVLLLGYLYAHAVVTRLGARTYSRAHLALIFLPFLVFPGRSLGDMASHAGVPLVIDVFLVLSLGIGCVFFVLSTTTVVMQSLLAASKLPERGNPYALYSVSNLGSFAALVSYPVFVEPWLDLNQQILFWRIAYAVLAVAHTALVPVVRSAESRQQSVGKPEPIPAARALRWFLLSAAGVTAFLSVTAIVTYEIAPMPLLWVIPLGIYLLAFVLNFKQRPWCPSWISDRFHEIAALGIATFVATTFSLCPVVLSCAAYFFVLFLICMLCQNRLAVTRPSDPRGLPFFYLVIAAGGFAAGVATSWIAPLVTPGMTEFLLVFVLIFLAGAQGALRKPLGWHGVRMVWYAIVLIVSWCIMPQRAQLLGIVLLFGALQLIFSALKRNPQALLAAAISIAILTPTYLGADVVFVRRNYYGVHRIIDKNGVRVLTHGTTIHGLQYLDPHRAVEPLGYYFRGSGIGKLLGNPAFDFGRVAIIGLGAGGILAYARDGQSVDVYEIDPLVERIARQYFTYLGTARAPVTITLGDARLQLGKSQARYDLLVVDAFSGDAIPVHLLTADALALYRSKLSPGGVLLFHVSNRYLDLVPVVAANAHMVGAHAFSHVVGGEMSLAAFPSRWVAVTWDEKMSAMLRSDGWRVCDVGAFVRPWTDISSSVLRALNIGGLLRISDATHDLF